MSVNYELIYTLSKKFKQLNMAPENTYKFLQNYNLDERQTKEFYGTVYGYIPRKVWNKLYERLINIQKLNQILTIGWVTIDNITFDINANSMILFYNYKLYPLELWMVLKYQSKISKGLNTLYKDFPDERKRDKRLNKEFPIIMQIYETFLRHGLDIHYGYHFILPILPTMILDMVLKYRGEAPLKLYTASDYGTLMALQNGLLNVSFDDINDIILDSFYNSLNYIFDHNLFNINTIYNGETLLYIYIKTPNVYDHIKYLLMHGADPNMVINGRYIYEYIDKKDLLKIVQPYIHPIRPDILAMMIDTCNLNDIYNVINGINPNITRKKLYKNLYALSSDEYNRILSVVYPMVLRTYRKMIMIQLLENVSVHKNTTGNNIYDLVKLYKETVYYKGKLLATEEDLLYIDYNYKNPSNKLLKLIADILHTKVRDILHFYLLQIGGLYLYKPDEMPKYPCLGCKSYDGFLYNPIYISEKKIAKTDNINPLMGIPWPTIGSSDIHDYYTEFMEKFNVESLEYGPSANEEIGLTMADTPFFYMPIKGFNATHDSYKRKFVDYLGVICSAFIVRFATTSMEINFD